MPHIRKNRTGAPNIRPTLTPTPQELIDVPISHLHKARYEYVRAGLRFGHLADSATDGSTSDVAAYERRSSR